MDNTPLTFDQLRVANMRRLPLFKNSKGNPAHVASNGADWTPAQWIAACLGELGEFANIRKKFERGDISYSEYAIKARKELADVQTYLDIVALRALDVTYCVEVGYKDLSVENSAITRCLITNEPHPTGIDLGEATREKFNEVSDRVGCDVKL